MRILFYAKNIALLLALTLSLWGRAQVIITRAGTPGVSGFAGDGGPAGEAQFGYLYVIAADHKGNLYIVDNGNGRLRRIDRYDIITTIAGTGAYGFSGDGVPATAAMLKDPVGVAADSIGAVYLTDAANFRIFKVDTFGIMTTIAGNGVAGFTGDGGPASSAQVGGVTDIKIDRKGNIYFVDNNRVRKINTSGIISTVAGDGEPYNYYGDGGAATLASLPNSNSIAVDKIGNLYISNYVYCTIRKVDTLGIIHLFAGAEPVLFVYPGGYSGDGGPALDALLDGPAGMDVDKDRNLFFADILNAVVRKIDTAGIITTSAGTVAVFGFGGDGGPATAAKLNPPKAVACDAAGNVYIQDYGNYVVREVIAGSVAAVPGIVGTGNVVNVFPNPLRSGVLLHIDNVPAPSSFHIISALGEEVQSGGLRAGNNTVRVGRVPCGVYFVEVDGIEGCRDVSQLVISD